jgi:ABC-2 type transport system ATP-binding protein
VDQVVIISQGSRMYAGALDALRGDGAPRVHLQCADPARLAIALAERGYTDIQATPDHGLIITGAPSRTIGDVALAAGVAIYRMAQERTDLEQRFLHLTSGDYQAGEQQDGIARPGWPIAVAPPPAQVSRPAGAEQPASPVAEGGHR